MPSTYSSNLRLELIGTGEQQGSWGSTTNNNLGTLIEQAISGLVSVTVSNVSDTTLTALDGLSDQSRNMIINLVGTISAARNVIVPQSTPKLYVVRNATTGGFAVTFKVSGQTGVSIPNGTVAFVYVDGTDVRAITGTLASQDASNVAITGGSITGITDLAIADGGTGASTAANARTNLGLAIGTNVQAYDATLQSLSSLGTAADRYAYTTGVDTWAEGTITSAGRAILDDADASAQRTTLGLGTAATLNVGTSANNIVQLDGTAKLPAVDGSQLTGISTFTMPSGAVMPYAGASEPSGWLLCFGQAVSRTTYAALFAIVGTTYGAGDGSTTFNLPDLRGRVVAGQDDMGGTSANRLTNQSGGVDGDVLGAAGGAETHTLTTAQMPAHNHTVANTLVTGTTGNISNVSLTREFGTTTSSSQGGGGAHNNVQPTFILNYIIKT